MVASRERRKEFVRNAIKFLRQNHFDGLDLDWEYPAFRDGGKPKDRENYAKLVKELREEFEKESQKTGKPRLLLTMAVPAGIEYIQKGFDVQTLNQYLDWMNLLTYDYHSAFEPAVNHHAPLYPLEEPNEYSVDNELNIDYTIKFYLENGADRDKLVLGIPTYGRSYTLFNPDAVEIGAPADGPGEQGDATREKGYLAYYEICEALKSKPNKKRSTSDEESEEYSDEEEEDWTVMHPNPKAMGPVAYKGNQWVGYDDIDIVKKKAEYVAENGLGGIMFWSIDNDDFRGNCHDKPYPLIEAAKEAYIVKLGATDNSIVTDRPQSVTRASSRRRNRPRVTSTTTTTTARPSSSRTKSSKRKPSPSVVSTTPTWNIATPEPPTTPDPGADFKCTDEGFFQHPRDCKKYFWCLDSGPSNLGIVAHQFTCPSGLFFNKAADSCDFARNVLCKKPAATTKAPATKAPSTTTTTAAPSTTRKPIKLSTRNSLLFRTTTTTTTTPEPESEEEYEEDVAEDNADIEAEDPRVIKELIDLIKKVGGVEQLEKHLHFGETSASTDGAITTTPSSFNKKLYQKVLERTRGKSKFGSNSISDSGTAQNSRRGPQNAGLEPTADKDKLLRKDRPQYTTINRSRPPTTAAPEPQEDSDESEDEIEEPPQQLSRARTVEEDIYVKTSAKPLQYVNIRRARPTTTSTSDTADDTASRNALFERVENYVSVSETPNTLDILSARRENVPEYVTIRRQRPTTEETTTAQYENTQQEVETQNTALEREISTQPQYTSIVRVRSTTEATIEEPSSPEPTTILAVQISSLLNSPSSAEDELETSPADEEITEAATTTTTTTSRPTTTTTSAPSSAPTRRTVLRRRGSTSTTTTTPAPSTSTQALKDRRNNFLRRTKATAPPDTTDTETETTDNVETTTSISKFTRRGGSKFKSRKETEKARIEKPAKSNRTDERRPTASRTSERPTRTFVRRRPGGANSSTTTPLPSSSSTSAGLTRRPFRVASRRRPASSTTTTTTTTEATTSTDSTAGLGSEESLQEIEDTDIIEDPTLEPRPATQKKTFKVQRRPLVNLKDTASDQNPSATNEDETKRQSKKYSASFKQNQLDEKLRQLAKSQESGETTEGKGTTIDAFNAETAVAIAAHQLLAAPIPSIPVFEEDTNPTKKSPITTTQQYYTSSETEPYTVSRKTETEPYTGGRKTETEPYTDSRKTVYFDEYTSTPIYQTPASTQDYIATGQVFTGLSENFDVPRVPPTTTYIPKSTFRSSTFPVKDVSPSAVPTPTIINPGLTGVSPTNSLRRVPPTNPGLSSLPPPIVSSSPRFASTTRGSSTPRYVSSSEKLIPVPVEDYAFSTGEYTGVSQEPAYFTREYLLESPVTKTYDDEYQYLSPVTTPQTSTRKVLRKKLQRKISTTIRPTTPTYEAPVTTPKPAVRRGQVRAKPFEKIKPAEPKRTYRPIENYDYYDDGEEKVAEKYIEGAKVVLHGKGTIECLDIGNFPHPTSCKKFISCSRQETGNLIGWAYICPKGLSFDPVGGICNWSAGLGCDEKDV
ncbi:mucin-5AC [Ostrinia furnacalis]|uniref:mucin-5AC n=1 Tax=Ostrinia furnacalis TaxID=93504 RepID=UPI00103FBC4C|nr:mucin-5AC [Ostrinia furnacalis]